MADRFDAQARDAAPPRPRVAPAAPSPPATRKTHYVPPPPGYNFAAPPAAEEPCRAPGRFARRARVRRANTISIGQTLRPDSDSDEAGGRGLAALLRPEPAGWSSRFGNIKSAFEGRERDARAHSAGGSARAFWRAAAAPRPADTSPRSRPPWAAEPRAPLPAPSHTHPHPPNTNHQNSHYSSHNKHPSTNNHQPSINKHQPSMNNNHQPPLNSSQQPSINNNNQPPLNHNHHPTMSNYPPPINHNYQPPISHSHQPSVTQSKHQPALSHNQHQSPLNCNPPAVSHVNPQPPFSQNNHQPPTNHNHHAPQARLPSSNFAQQPHYTHSNLPQTRLSHSKSHSNISQMNVPQSVPLAPLSPALPPAPSPPQTYCSTTYAPPAAPRTPPAAPRSPSWQPQAKPFIAKPIPVNQFSHAPMSAFKPLKKIASPTPAHVWSPPSVAASPPPPAQFAPSSPSAPWTNGEVKPMTATHTPHRTHPQPPNSQELPRAPAPPLVHGPGLAAPALVRRASDPPAPKLPEAEPFPAIDTHKLQIEFYERQIREKARRAAPASPASPAAPAEGEAFVPLQQTPDIERARAREQERLPDVVMTERRDDDEPTEHACGPARVMRGPVRGAATRTRRAQVPAAPAAPAPPRPRRARADSAQLLAVPRLFEAGAAVLSDKRRAVESYFAGARPAGFALGRSRTMPTVAELQLLDETNADQAFEDLVSALA